MTRATTGSLPGLPRDRVQAWFSTELPDMLPAEQWTVELVAGGLSNLTYRLRMDSGNLILRRPPLGGHLPRAHDMSREYTVQSALAVSDVPVPEVLALCADPSVIGAPFYVMREVPGQVMRCAADTGRLSPTSREKITVDLIEILARLHALDHRELGLAGFGSRRGRYVERQVRRWGEQWRRSATRDLRDMDLLLAKLSDWKPRGNDSVIVHGDYRLDNVVVRPASDPHIAAILDWELSTVGDPIADLGTLLAYWRDSQMQHGAAFSQAEGLTAPAGFPSADDLADRYATLSGRTITNLELYEALGTMKLAVILEGVHRRQQDGDLKHEGEHSVAYAVPVLVARALYLLGTARRSEPRSGDLA